VRAFADYLGDRQKSINLSPDFVANWYSASMFRMTSMFRAEIKGRAMNSSESLTLSDEDFEVCIDLAIDGFEGVEENAEKLLDSMLERGDIAADRLRERNTDVER